MTFKKLETHEKNENNFERIVQTKKMKKENV